MTIHTTWGAALVAASVLASCGGGSGSGMETTPIPWPEIHKTDSGTALPPAKDTQHSEMREFKALPYQSYATASLKLLISAIGPQKLTDHLRDFEKRHQNTAQATAATAFIALIEKAYEDGGPVNAQELLATLQELAPFNKRNAAGDWEFKIARESFPKESDPAQFLTLLAELFELDKLADGSFDVQDTYVYQGEERVQKRTKSPFQIFQVIDTRPLNITGARGENLQKIVDQLHTDGTAQVLWNAGDTAPSTVQVRRQVTISDTEQFKRLAISLQGSPQQTIAFSLEQPVTLPAVDAKTRRKLLLKLEASEAIDWGQSEYTVSIRDAGGKWKTDDLLSGFRFYGSKDSTKLINFTVKDITVVP